MGLNPITFTLAQGGIGTPIPGSDYISGMLHYSSSTPSGFTQGVAKALFGVTDAEAAGILANYNDETQATATATLTLGSVGDTIKLTVTEPGINGTTNIVNLGTYTVASTDTTSTILAASVAAFINSGTLTHGYTATSATTVVTIHARVGTGISLNTGTPLSDVITGTTTVTLVQFSGGVASKQAIWHYQISEYFRMQPSGKLWVAFFAVPSTYTFAELETIQTQVNGEIRQFGVYSAHGTSVSNINADLDAIQAVGVSMFNDYAPAVVLYASNMTSITDLSTLSNLRLRSDNYVSCVIAQDGGGLGATLALTTGASVPAYGACLGTVALANVENDIAWVGAFNISSGSEDAVLAFANGTLYNSVSKGLRQQLDNYGYIFLTYVVGTTGSYWNDSHSATSITSDYAYIERNRVIQKAMRILNIGFTPLIKSDLDVNQDGTLQSSTINIFKNAVTPSMSQMVANGEISAYDIIIDPRQNVESTSTINIVLKIVGVGIARHIAVTLGYVLSI